MRFFIFQSKYKAFGSSSSHSKPRIISMWYQHREVRLWSWLCQRLESPHSPCPGCLRVMSPCYSLVQDVHSLSAMTCPSSAAGACLTISVTQKVSIVVYIYIYILSIGIYIYIMNKSAPVQTTTERALVEGSIHVPQGPDGCDGSISAYLHIYILCLEDPRTIIQFFFYSIKSHFLCPTSPYSSPPNPLLFSARCR